MPTTDRCGIAFVIAALAALALLVRLGSTHAPAPILVLFGIMVGGPLLGIAYRLGRRDGRLSVDGSASRIPGEIE